MVIKGESNEERLSKSAVKINRNSKGMSSNSFSSSSSSFTSSLVRVRGYFFNSPRDDGVANRESSIKTISVDL